MKFDASDKRYREERRRLSEKYGPRELWSVADHWPLYSGIANIGRFLAISDLLRSTLDVPGHVIEFGTWRGANLLFMAKILKLYDPHGSKRIHCFDSFEGLATFSDQDGGAAESRGDYAGSFDELLDLIRLYELDDDIDIHKGEIQTTLPEFLAGDQGTMFSFVFCDVDLYEPTKLILELMHDRLTQGGLFVLDEWNDERWPGESLAVKEFLDLRQDSYHLRHVRHARQPTLALQKLGA